MATPMECWNQAMRDQPSNPGPRFHELMHEHGLMRRNDCRCRCHDDPPTVAHVGPCSCHQLPFP